MHGTIGQYWVTRKKRKEMNFEVGDSRSNIHGRTMSTECKLWYGACLTWEGWWRVAIWGKGVADSAMLRIVFIGRRRRWSRAITRARHLDDYQVGGLRQFLMNYESFNAFNDDVLQFCIIRLKAPRVCGVARPLIIFLTMHVTFSLTLSCNSELSLCGSPFFCVLLFLLS